jgi:hypothetical protein
MIGRATLAVVVWAFACLAAAAPDPRSAAEIAGLLAAVENAGCTFVRSGEAFDGPAARRHLERKYEQARPRLATAEQFIEHVASRSSLTGEAYRVRCAGREQASATWLASELARMRADAASGTAPLRPQKM